MAQPENIWMTLAYLIMASANPGTVLYMVARTVIIVSLLSGTLPPLTPKLQKRAAKLKEKHLKLYNKVSLTDPRSWKRYMSKARPIWVKARQLQRKIDKLKKKLQLAKVRALRSALEAALREPQSGGRTQPGMNTVI
ncbi:uncharacterized protein EV420DRAFT_1643317 [Desarmillaria tabescens]|uniref:Uncharacterized protein n=1 Tax=Armillaria tabescens TaxID=1929756 RepID=A0AA39KDP6_ARMTA|nr:uncharacterized protein EV420DRAFT_1643317 [Desarmillaria tabescens]KAK0457961.1 hypothetical protein EV420DRAFT_1643317 [Desarmillaria tabescens]